MIPSVCRGTEYKERNENVVPELRQACKVKLMRMMIRDRGGYRQPPELGKGGNKGRSGTEGGHEAFGKVKKQGPHDDQFVLCHTGTRDTLGVQGKG